MKYWVRVVVRLGKDAACVVGVSMDKVELLNEEGQEVVVGVQKFTRNWKRFSEASRGNTVLVPGTTSESAALWDSRCVGMRGALDQPPWVELMDVRSARVEFRTCEEIYEQLLDPLQRNGLHTVDAN